MASISDIAAEVALDEEVIDFVVLQKNGEPYLADDGSECTIGVTGRDAQGVTRVADLQTRRLLKARAKSVEPSDLRRNRIEIAASAVKRWSGWTDAGKPFPCTSENAIALLSATHLLEQVEEKMAGHASFFTTASPTR